MGPIGTYTKLDWSFDTIFCRRIAKEEENRAYSQTHIFKQMKTLSLTYHDLE